MNDMSRLAAPSAAFLDGLEAVIYEETSVEEALSRI